MIQDTVRDLIGDGDAVIAWASLNDAGFEFETFGANRRIPVEFDGLRLVSFLLVSFLPQPPALCPRASHQVKNRVTAWRTPHACAGCGSGR